MEFCGSCSCQGETQGTGTLYAYDATDLTREFYDSSQVAQSRCGGHSFEIYSGHGGQRQGLRGGSESTADLWTAEIEPDSRKAYPRMSRAFLPGFVFPDTPERSAGLPHPIQPLRR